MYTRNHASSPLFWQRFAPPGYTIDVKTVTSSVEIQSALETGDLDIDLIGTYSTILAKDQGGFNSKIIGMTARRGIGPLREAWRMYPCPTDPARPTRPG